MATTKSKTKRAAQPAAKKKKKTISRTSIAKKSSAKRTAKKGGAKRGKRPRPSPPAKPGPVNEWMELRESPIHGLGAFALKDIPKGTRIIEYVGERISNAEADRRYNDENMDSHHTFLFILNDKECLDAAFDGNESRFINHSCDPNAEAFIPRGRIWIEAIKKIPKGTEIAYDYAFEDDPKYTIEDYRRYGCRCGAKNCRGTIVETKRKLNL